MEKAVTYLQTLTQYARSCKCVRLGLSALLAALFVVYVLPGYCDTVTVFAALSTPDNTDPYVTVPNPYVNPSSTTVTIESSDQYVFLRSDDGGTYTFNWEYSLIEGSCPADNWIDGTTDITGTTGQTLTPSGYWWDDTSMSADCQVFYLWAGSYNATHLATAYTGLSVNGGATDSTTDDNFFTLGP